ncbi:ATP-binding protein [Thermosphaera chiliense]|uniref:ATP-binding protein n=1 Tax=Thermosphaera chiliense TaxID=3402707 RepID=A0A7M1US73_9CREN|nr:ATP-binding protein [Thermosphaera aggregans]QOR94367.1 ATP-binding protein [Thermosphaera aggregans]
MNTDFVKSLENKLTTAVEIAKKYGRIIGFVSRTSPSRIDEEGGFVYFEVDPLIYFNEFMDIASAGGYLAVVDLKTLHLVSLKIAAVERRDVLAELDVPEMYVAVPTTEVTGLLTKTRIKAKPLLSYDVFTDTVISADYVIEPQSPVIKLEDTRAIQKILGLPTKGVFLGYVTVGDKVLFEGNAELYLPLKAFYQHILVVGTTGSGKTTLIKNMVTSLSSKFNTLDDASVVIIDPNRDYLTLNLEPPWIADESLITGEKKLLERLAGKVEHPRGIIILLPVTKYVVSKHVEEGSTWAKILRNIALEYFRDIVEPISYRFGFRYEVKNIDVIEQPGDKFPLRYVKLSAVIDYKGRREEAEYIIIPYAFRFTDFTPREFISLNPYFTRQAKDSLTRLLRYMYEAGLRIETVYDIYDALRDARARLMEREKAPRGIVLDPNKEHLVELVKEIAIHKSTLENILRQVGSIIDTGFFDIAVSTQSGEKYLQEPPLELILDKHFEWFNGYPIVADLEYPLQHSIADPEKVLSIIAFRILNKIFEWKLQQTRGRMESKPVIIIMDEAHRFFPSKSGVEDYVEHVSSMIDRIARLGRARKLGIVFSTHSPRDVHDIILQLANTKIILRTDKSHIGLLDLPQEYRETVVRMSDRVAVLKSHVLRLGYVTFKTTPPLAGHYDLSALESPGQGVFNMENSLNHGENGENEQSVKDDAGGEPVPRASD